MWADFSVVGLQVEKTVLLFMQSGKYNIIMYSGCQGTLWKRVYKLWQYISLRFGESQNVRYWQSLCNVSAILIFHFVFGV